jgi:hypothetical protein
MLSRPKSSGRGTAPPMGRESMAPYAGQVFDYVSILDMNDREFDEV